MTAVAALEKAAAQMKAAAETHKRSAAAHRRKAREAYRALEVIEAEAKALGLKIQRTDQEIKANGESEGS